MSRVLDAVREKYPQYKDVPDDKLALAIGDKYPSYAQSDPDFAKEVESARNPKSSPPGWRPTDTEANEFVRKSILPVVNTAYDTLTSPAVGEASEMGRQQLKPPRTRDELAPYNPGLVQRLQTLAPSIFGQPGEQPPDSVPKGALPALATVLYGDSERPGVMRFSPADIIPEQATPEAEFTRKATGMVNIENLGIIKGLGILAKGVGPIANWAKAAAAGYFAKQGAEIAGQSTGELASGTLTPGQTGGRAFDAGMGTLMALGPGAVALERVKPFQEPPVSGSALKLKKGAVPSAETKQAAMLELGRAAKFEFPATTERTPNAGDKSKTMEVAGGEPPRPAAQVATGEPPDVQQVARAQEPASSKSEPTELPQAETPKELTLASVIKQAEEVVELAKQNNQPKEIIDNLNAALEGLKVRKAAEQSPPAAPPAPPPVESQPATGKEAWQMTKAEWENGPPVKRGYVRLWRGEDKKPIENPTGSEGRWFSTSRETADFFAGNSPSTDPTHVVYVDIPAKDLPKYDALNLPEGQRPPIPDEQAYVLPPELAAQKKHWVDYHGDGHGDLVATALEAGKPVPAEVLRDYPDLAPKPHALGSMADYEKRVSDNLSRKGKAPPPVPLKEPTPAPTATGKEIPELQRLTEKVESGQKLTPAEKKRYLKLTGRNGAPPESEVMAGPGSPSASQTMDPTGSQIEQLSQAFKRIGQEKVPLSQKVKEAFALGQQRELSKDLIARTLSALKTSGDWLIDTWRGQGDLDPILKTKGQLSYELEARGWRMRQAMKEMRRAVPSRAAREAIAKYVDAGGDTSKLQESAATVPAGRRQAYVRAMQLSADEKIVAEHIRSYFDSRLQEAIDAGVVSQGIEDYIHRIYPRDTQWRKGVINAVQNGVLDTRTPGLAKQRIFELDADAERAGYAPVSDFIPRILDYEASLSKVIASRAAVKRFSEIKMPDGNKMIEPAGLGIPIESPEGVREATLINPSRKPGEWPTSADGRPYVGRDYPALKKWKWASNDTEGNPIFVQGDVMIHPDAVHRIDALLEPSKVRKYAAARAALTVGSVFKQTMLDFSGFHQVQIAVHGLEHKVNPFNLVKEIDTTDPKIVGLLKGGMTLGGEHVSGLYQEGLVGRSLSRQVPGLGQLMQSYHDYLFQDFIPRVKTTMALHALERNRTRFAKDLASGRMTEGALYHQTAKEANAAFGELNYIMLERSKTAQDLSRLVLLAPDFLEARGRFALQAATRLGGEQRMALLLGGLTMYAVARIWNKAVNDDYHWEPENAFSLIYKGKAYSLRTVQGDILHAIEEPVRFWLHRLNPTITRPLFELATGRDEFGRKRDFWQVMGDSISNIVPISLRSSREQSLFNSFLNAFGVGVRRYSDIQKTYQAANDWKTKNKIRGEPGEFIYDPAKDVYRGLKLAILDGNDAIAASEYRKLMDSKAVTAAQATEHFNRYARSPFTGSVGNEAKFKRTLSEEQLREYEAARQEKQRILQGFYRAKLARTP